MSDFLKKDVISGYQQLQELGLSKYSRGIISAISRETGSIVYKTADSLIVGSITDDIPRLQTHICIYKAFPNISAIVEPYGKYTTVFAQIGADIPVLGKFHETFFHNDIPCISSSDELYRIFTERCIDPHETSAALVLHNGGIAWGYTIQEAIRNADYLEETASLAYLSLQLDPGLVSLR